MKNLPGGQLSRRALHFIWIADCSGSMSLDGKIQALNQAIRQSIRPMRDVAKNNPNSEVFVRCLKFSNGANWHIKNATRIEEFEWVDLKADPVEYINIETEIIFLLDTSGSMSKEIQAVRLSCVDFANKIIKNGSNVRLGLVGFAIGEIRNPPKNAEIQRLKKYNLGIWTLSTPNLFRESVQSLRLRSLGGKGCYLADQDTVEIFSIISKLFSNKSKTKKILVIISDELGNTTGVNAISSELQKHNIRTYVLGLPGALYAHEAIARQTKGEFWDIQKLRERHGFDSLLDEIAETIVREIQVEREDGSKGTGTDMGRALIEISKVMKIPPMPVNALPPVLALISDGKPHDDFMEGYNTLLSENWGVKAVKLAIAIGKDADKQILGKFMETLGIGPLEANNPEALLQHIRWVSTKVLDSVSSPNSKTDDMLFTKGHVPILRQQENIDVNSIW